MVACVVVGPYWVALAVISIPPSALSEAALAGVIDEYITREGTDYGHSEFSLDAKRAAVRAQLDSGEAMIWFDPATSTTTLSPAT